MIACAGMPKVARLPRFSARPGLYPKIIGYKRVERCIARWKAENAEKAAETAVENSENQGE